MTPIRVMSVAGFLALAILSPPAVAEPSSAVRPRATQAVAVAFLEPKTEIDVDVTTGAVSIGGYGEPFEEPPQEETGLAGFVDPYQHGLFVYRSGGIAGVQEANRALGQAQVPALGLPDWAPPGLQPTGPQSERVVLADGRYAEISDDEQGRATQVRWPTAGGPWVSSTIGYAPGRTTVRMPFGIIRTYAYGADGRVTSVVAPGARSHARHDTVDGLLDTSQTRHLRAKRLPVFGHAENTIDNASHGSLGNVYSDEPANGGYAVFGVDSLAAARRVNRTIAHLGLLDMAEAIPERHSFRQFKHESDQLAPLFKLLGACVVSTGVRFGAGVDVDIARTITAREVERLDQLLLKIPDWVYIYYGSSTECSEPV
jgi:hypothetical protein